MFEIILVVFTYCPFRDGNHRERDSAEKKRIRFKQNLGPYIFEVIHEAIHSKNVSH